MRSGLLLVLGLILSAACEQGHSTKLSGGADEESIWRQVMSSIEKERNGVPSVRERALLLGKATESRDDREKPRMGIGALSQTAFAFNFVELAVGTDSTRSRKSGGTDLKQALLLLVHAPPRRIPEEVFRGLGFLPVMVPTLEQGGLPWSDVGFVADQQGHRVHKVFLLSRVVVVGAQAKVVVTELCGPHCEETSISTFEHLNGVWRLLRKDGISRA